MKFFKDKKVQEANEAVSAADTESVVDMTELAAAIAKLNDEEPPSGTVFVPASTFPVSEQIKREAEEAAAKRAARPDVGQKTAEGIYIGCFKGNDGEEKDWFAAPADVRTGNSLILDFNEAARFAQGSRDLGHDDWIVPPGWDDRDGRPDILAALFNSKSTKAFEGTFNETGPGYVGWYWSSSSTGSIDVSANIKRFSDGAQLNGIKSTRQALRLVRSDACSGGGSMKIFNKGKKAQEALNVSG